MLLPYLLLLVLFMVIQSIQCHKITFFLILILKLIKKHQEHKLFDKTVFIYKVFNEDVYKY